MNLRNLFLILTVLSGMLLCGTSVTADETASEEEKQFWYDDGINAKTRDGRFNLHLEWRAQVRYSNEDLYNGFGDPDSESADLGVNRARVKLGGELGAPWLPFYSEFDFVRMALLDLWIAPEFAKSHRVRIGQYKVPFNRERFDSSGKQQFAERSIVTPAFTLDRQIGATAMGRFNAGGSADFSYAAGAFIGNGRAASSNDDNQPLVFGRLQWNFLGRELPFSQSDIKRHEKPTASLAVAVSTNRSPFTRFSSDGGGQLDGYPDGEAGEYDVDQALLEFALMYQGFSIQSELHWKEIDDVQNDLTNSLTGYYISMGYFFSEVIDWVPEPLELIVRFAQVRPGSSMVMPDNDEFAFGANWFFYGHRNKVTLDITKTNEAGLGNEDPIWGLRLQWDVSF